MENLVRINLYGDLGKHVGKTWKLAVSSVGEAIEAIEILSKRKLYHYLYSKNKSGVRYKVLINENIVKYEDGNDIHAALKSEIALQRQDLRSIDIIPVIEGAGDVLDIFTTILGVALIIGGIILSGGLGAALIVAGIGLTVAGISSALTKPPSFEPFQEFESGGRPSYLFAGPQNVVREGGPVPVVYGEAIVGSQTIASNFKIEFFASEVSNSLAKLKGDLDSDLDVILYNHTYRISRHSVQNTDTPIISFDFHPLDDELIVPFHYTVQDTQTAPLTVTEVDIIKIKDTATKISSRSNFTTNFYNENTPWGQSTKFVTRGVNKFKPHLRHFSSGNSSLVVHEIKTNRSSNQIFVGGEFEHRYTLSSIIKGVGTGPAKNLICIESDGDVSTTFSHPQPNGIVSAINFQSDGKILIGGEFTAVQSTSPNRNYFARLNSNGTLDTLDLSLTGNKFIKAIEVATVNGTEYAYIAGNGGFLKKYNTSTGAEDTVFTGNLPVIGTGTIWALTILNGWLVVGGDFSFTDSSITFPCLFRVNKDTGELDTTFAFTFETLSYTNDGLKPIQDHMGDWDSLPAEAVQTYSYPRTDTFPSVRSLDIDLTSSGVYVSGSFDSVNSDESVTTRNLVFIKDDGTIDKSFNPRKPTAETGTDGHIQHVRSRRHLPTSDKKVFIGGRFTHYNSTAYTPEELDILQQRTVFTPKDRSVVNIARLFGKI